MGPYGGVWSISIQQLLDHVRKTYLYDGDIDRFESDTAFILRAEDEGLDPHEINDYLSRRWVLY